MYKPWSCLWSTTCDRENGGIGLKLLPWLYSNICADVKNCKWRLNPVWHRMLYNCTHMASVDIKWLNGVVLFRCGRSWQVNACDVLNELTARVWRQSASPRTTVSCWAPPLIRPSGPHTLHTYSFSVFSYSYICLFLVISVLLKPCLPNARVFDFAAYNLLPFLPNYEAHGAQRSGKGALSNVLLTY